MGTFPLVTVFIYFETEFHHVALTGVVFTE